MGGAEASSCPACGHGNRGGLRFCTQCGAALSRTCPSCRAPIESAANFCGVCGASLGEPAARPAPESRAYTPKHLADRILQSRAALEGERKQVTVLFADVRGSMELADSVDPEEWHRILDRFFAILADGVHRFEGTVNQYTGDGIMALFGAPIAHEDHAQRACHAALHLREQLRTYARELRRAHGVDFSTRIGINSGEVIVGRIGDDLRMDYTAQGHTVGVAQRMEALAEAGSVYVSAATARLVEGFFTFEDLGEFAIKGLSAPTRVFALQGVGQIRSRFERSRARGLSRFVGRDAELALLDAALDRLDQGQGGRIGIVGDAGVGKSRLCHEIAERARARGYRIFVVGCPPFGKSIPLHLSVAAMRASFGVDEHDSPAIAREKIAGRMVQLDPALVNDVSFMCDAVGVPDPERPVPEMAEEDRLRRWVAIGKQMKQAYTAQGVRSLWVMEDMHWCDAASEAQIGATSGTDAANATLRIFNFRPEYRPPWADARDYQQIVLSPLADASAEELLRHLLGADVPAEVRSAIVHRAGGNPFFAEEIVRTLTESGHLEGDPGRLRVAKPIEALSIPESVRAVLAARIDRLADHDKALLGTAAILGQQFGLPLLERVSGIAESDLIAALERLSQAGMVYEAAVHPEIEYSFQHPLTREVAEASLLSDRRKRMHRAAATAIELLRQGRLDESAALIGRHYEGAGEMLDAARWYARSANWLQPRNVVEAERTWQQVQTLVQSLPGSREALELLVQVSERRLYVAWQFDDRTHEEVDALHALGVAAARQLDDASAEIGMEGGLATFQMTNGKVDRAVRVVERMLPLADARGTALHRFYARSMLGIVYAVSGRLSQSVRYADEALELWTRNFGDDPARWNTARIWIPARRLISSMQMSDLRGAAAQLRELLEIGRRTEFELPRGGLLEAYANFVELSGEFDDVRLRVEQALDLAARTESPVTRQGARNTAGRLLFAAGDVDAARSLAEPSIAISNRARRDTMWIALTFVAVEPARAKAYAAELVRGARATSLRVSEIKACLAHAQVLREVDGASAADEIAQLLARVDVLIGETEARAFEPFVLEDRARLAQALGNPEAATRLLRGAHARFTEIGATGHARRLGQELGG